MAEPRVLLVFHTDEGQTGKIAHRIAESMSAAGATVERCDADRAPEPDAYDVVVMGDSIHAGQHSKALRRYASEHRVALGTRPVGLFQVSLTSANDDTEHTATAHQMVEDFLEQTGADPDVVGLFAGAIAYTKYGWFKRQLMKRIAAHDGIDTDTSVDHEYTDWDAVEEFARDALSLAGASS